jgi:hypothetical protein
MVVFNDRALVGGSVQVRGVRGAGSRKNRQTAQGVFCSAQSHELNSDEEEQATTGFLEQRA